MNKVSFLDFFKNNSSENDKRETPNIRKTVSNESLENLTEHQLKELLSNLKEEKEIVLFGFDRMSQTHREAAIAKKEKIEEMIENVENAIGDCYFKF
jgi:hypothetical protein